MALSKIQMSEMLAAYGQLLTEKQRDVISMYCDCDCTLSEIAAEKNITRQGVRATILNVETTFSKLEDALHLAELVRTVDKAIQQDDDQTILAAVKKFVGKE